MGGCDVALKLGSGPSHLPGYLFELILEFGVAVSVTARSPRLANVRSIPLDWEVDGDRAGQGRAAEGKKHKVLDEMWWMEWVHLGCLSM